MEMPRPALPNPTSRTGMDRVETHSRWFTGPMLYQLATAPGSQKVKLYLEASKNWGMLFTFHLEISEDRKHTDEGFTGVGGWQGRRVSSVIRCHEREVWGPPYPCSQTAWKPVLRVPPAGAQTWAEGQEPLRLWFSRRACAPLVRALERCTLAKKIPDATSMEAPYQWRQLTSDLIWLTVSPSSEMTSLWLCLCSGAPIPGAKPEYDISSRSPRRETGWEMGRENQGGREGSHEKVMYSPTGHVSQHQTTKLSGQSWIHQEGQSQHGAVVHGLQTSSPPRHKWAHEVDPRQEKINSKFVHNWVISAWCTPLLMFMFKWNML